MIRFGIAGIPLSSKGRTLRDGIEDAYLMGLTALEVQFLKVNIFEKEAFEESGLYPREVVPDKKEESRIIVNISRADKNGNFVPIGINSKIEENDILQILQWNLARSYEELRDLKTLTKELDIKINIHTPYYMDLINDPNLIERSMNYILWSSYLGNELGADMVISNIGLYEKLKSNDALKIVDKNVKQIQKKLKSEKINLKLGFETSEKKEVFGTLDELVALSSNNSGVLPVINFAKLFARQDYTLKEKEEFETVLDMVKPYYKNELYFQFAGVEFTANNDIRISPVKKGDLKFEDLADLLVHDDREITIISNSPLIEHDAQYMRIIYERKLGDLLQKKVKK